MGRSAWVQAAPWLVLALIVVGGLALVGNELHSQSIPPPLVDVIVPPATREPWPTQVPPVIPSLAIYVTNFQVMPTWTPEPSPTLPLVTPPPTSDPWCDGTPDPGATCKKPIPTSLPPTSYPSCDESTRTATLPPGSWCVWPTIPPGFP